MMNGEMTRNITVILTMLLLVPGAALVLQASGETGAPVDSGQTEGDGTPIWETAGDWTVEDTDELAHEGRTIVVNGDLTVAGGTLDLTDVKLVVKGNVTVSGGNLTGVGLHIVMQAADGSSNWFDVGNGGNLTIVNGTFSPENASNPYTVLLGGTSDLTNVTFNRTGTRTTAGVAWGVKVGGAEATFVECTFHNASGTALYVDPASAVVMDTVFRDGAGEGIVATGSHLEVQGCEFINLSGGDALVINTSSFSIDDVVFEDSGGISVDACGPDEGPAEFEHENATLLSRCALEGAGIIISGSEVTVDRADVAHAPGDGVVVSGTPAGSTVEIGRSKATGCGGAGLNLTGRGILVHNTTARKNTVGLWLDEGRGGKLVDNVIEENDLGVMVSGALELGEEEYGMAPALTTNALDMNGVGIRVTADGCALYGNHVTGSSGAGIVVSGALASLTSREEAVTGNGGPGLESDGCQDLAVTGGTFAGNGLGAPDQPEVLADALGTIALQGTALGGGSGYAVLARGTTEVELDSVAFQVSTAQDLVRLEDSAHLRLTTTSVAPDRIVVNGTGSAESYWDVAVNIMGPGDAPLVNAIFAVEDAQGNEVYNATAPQSSFTHSVKVFTVDSAGAVDHTPHVFKAIHPELGYKSLTRDVTGGATINLRVLTRDLFVDSITFSEAFGLPGSAFSVMVDVWNGGLGDVGAVDVTLVASTGLSTLGNWTVELPGVPAGLNATAHFGPLTFTDPGTFMFTAWVDQAGKYYETSKENNSLSASFVINGRPIANITADVPTAPTGVEISFNASGSTDPQGITSYRFDFGDGSGTGWQASPGATHAYVDDGEYTARVWVIDALGARSSSPSQMTVTISNRDPQASFTFKPLEGATIETLFRFTSSSSDADGAIEEYAWDFGDGDTSTQPSPAHSFDDDAVYTVTLVVTDDDGGVSAGFSAEVSVINTLPVIYLTGEGTEAGVKTAGVPMAFDASSSRDLDDPHDSLTFLWDMGDGTDYDEARINHTYAAAGVYNVTIRVGDDDSTESNASTYVYRVLRLTVRAGPEDADGGDGEGEGVGDGEGAIDAILGMWMVIVIVVVVIVGVLGVVLSRRDKVPGKMDLPLHCDHCGTYFPAEDLGEGDKCPSCRLVVSETAAEVVELVERPKEPLNRGK